MKLTACAALTAIVLTVVFVLIEGVPSTGWDWSAVNAMATMLSGLAASAGLLFVGLQMNSNRRLAHAQFVSELGRDIDAHFRAQSCLEPNRPVYDAVERDLSDREMALIQKYLNFFERVEYIRDTRVLDMAAIDGFFAYRFFNLVHNPNVQKQVLYRLAPYYRAIFKLHQEWLAYRQSRNLPVPRPETPLHGPKSA